MKPTSQSTFWRVCRVLANRTRLRMFALLLDHPGLTVSAIAARVQLPVSAASDHLRALNTHGFLTVRRIGRWVQYWPGVDDSSSDDRSLADALREKLECDRKAIDSVFKIATAFTHPRRPEIFRALKEKPRTLGRVVAETGVPSIAALRHLHKLHARGFIGHARQYPRTYTIKRHPDAFARKLASLCCQAN